MCVCVRAAHTHPQMNIGKTRELWTKLTDYINAKILGVI